MQANNYRQSITCKCRTSHINAVALECIGFLNYKHALKIHSLTKVYVCTTTSSSSCSEKQLRVPTCSISALVTVLLALGSSLPGKSHNTIPHTGGQVRMYNDVQLLMTKTCIPELITKKRMRCTAASRWSHQRPSQDYGHSKAGFTRNARQR